MRPTFRTDESDWTPPTESSGEEGSDSARPRKLPPKKNKKPKTRKHASGGIKKLDPPRRKRLKSRKELNEVERASGDVPQADPPQPSLTTLDPNDLTDDDEFCTPLSTLKQEPAPISSGEKVISIDQGKGGIPDEGKTAPGRDRENPVCIEDRPISQASALQSGQEPKDQTTESVAAFKDMDEEELRLKLLETELKREEVSLKLRLKRLKKRS
ncbi:uncharacterized protein J3D65DRAFT_657397 [Phyllosticta citribraziliensis]|uniref:Uncharacterized protein n=1 Tax=Phyllosticta citribraziliensis TaxID=989973 RepID=A0ABR1M1D6_9PEZI